MFGVGVLRTKTHSTMQSFIERFIPETIRQNAESLRRARIIVSSALLVAVSALFYGLQHLFISPSLPSSVTLWVGSVLCVLVPFVLRGSGSLWLAGTMLVSIYWAVVVTLMTFEGGIQADMRFWIVATPIMATLLLGARSGTFWAVLTLVALAAFFAMQQAHIPLPAFTPTLNDALVQSVLSGIGLALFMTVLARLAAKANTEALTTLETERIEEARRASENLQRLDAMRLENERRASEDLQVLESQRAYLAHSIEQILYAVHALAKGDLTVSVHVGNADDIQRLSDGLTRSVATVRQMLEHVALAIHRAAQGVDAISAATEELAATAEEQTNQVLQVSTAVEEMSNTITETTQQTSVAAFEASEANMDAQQGGEVMKKLIGNVQQVGEVVLASSEKVLRLGVSSEHIGEIVSVIDEIADQTNLLALNAAIEAARAGEHGKGFSVVADEVRKLAERTQRATKQISQMIKSIQHDMSQAVAGMNQGKELVRQGSELVGQTTQALEQIVGRTSKVAEVISSVALASDEQAATSNDMAMSVTQMAAVVEQSSRGLTDIARSIERLSRQANELRHLIGYFTIDARTGVYANATLPAQPTAKQLR
jgi:methyl-accepting chemotaxis protein